LEFHQAAFQGGLGLSVGELGHPWIGSWIALGRLGTAGWAGSGLGSVAAGIRHQESAAGEG
jgi:hypothetical protein